MNCIKCGREISENEVFCPKCLELMEQCPVKPDIVVQLPVRQMDPVKRPVSRKKLRTPEEQILRLKRRNRFLAATVCLLLAACIFLTFLSIDYFRQLDVQRFLGQNYSTVETTK